MSGKLRNDAETSREPGNRRRGDNRLDASYSLFNRPDASMSNPTEPPGMTSLISQVQTMIEESGRPVGFNAAEWVARWIDRPLPALGGQKPADLMGTAKGRALVSTIVARMQNGAYS
jgi:hypothetical protein